MAGNPELLRKEPTMSRRNSHERKGIVGAVLALPDGILTLCCFAVPLVVIVLYSFWRIDLTTFTVTTDCSSGNSSKICRYTCYCQLRIRLGIYCICTYSALNIKQIGKWICFC